MTINLQWFFLGVYLLRVPEPLPSVLYPKQNYSKICLVCLTLLQMELVRSPDFTTNLAASLNSNEEFPAEVTAAGLGYNSLGYIVLYDEEQVCVVVIFVVFSLDSP